MSYRVTEAERKHVAAIEDTKIAIEREPADGQTSKLFVHITDGDKLNLREELPSYKFAVEAEDDKASRLRLIDTTDEDHQIVCEGATINGKVQGLGWRYKIVFNKAKDDDKYVDSIKLVRENDGKTDELTFRNFNILNIKSLTVDNDFTAKGTVSLKAGAVVEGNLEVNADADENGGSVTAKELHASKTVSTDINATSLAVADSLSTKGLATTGDVSVSNGTVTLASSSVVADSTVDITADHASIAKLSSSTVESASIANSGKITTGSIDTDLVNVTTVNSLNADVHNADIDTAEIGSATATSASIETLTAGSVETTGKTKTDSFEAASSKVVDETVSTLSVTDETVKTSSIDALTAKQADIASATITKAAATDASIGNAEAKTLLVSGDATVANDLKVSGTTTVSQINTLDGSKVFTYNEDNSTLGSNDKLLVLKSSSDKTLSEDDDSYGHIKAVVGNKESYLATMDDLERLNPLGVVDRSSNQTISGVKTFENQIIARGGVTFKDDDGHIKNVISHISNYNESKEISNPKYVQAKAEYDAYETQLAAKDDVYAKYTAAVDAKAGYVDAKTAADNAHKDYETKLASQAEALVRKNDAQAALEAYEPVEKEAAAAKEAALEAKNESTNAAETAKSAYDKASDTYDTELAAAKWYVFDNDDIAWFKANVDDVETDKTDWKAIFDYSIAHTYEEAIDGADSLTAKIDEIIASSPVDATAYVTSLSTAKEKLANKKTSNEAEAKELKTANDEAETAYSTAKEQQTKDETAYSTASGKYDEAKSELDSKQKEATDTSAAYEAQTALVNDAKEDDTKAADAAEKANAAAKAADSAFFLSYESYYATYLNEQVQITELKRPEIPEVAITELAQSYKDNDIPSTILKYDPDHIFLGDSEDELQIKTKALANGDEHIQATIGGKAHLLANTDDILVGINDGSKNTVITDVSTATDAGSKTVSISTVTERMEKGGTDEKDRFKPVTETVGTLKFGSRFNIASNDDGSTSVDIDLSDIADGVVSDVKLEDNKLSVTKSYGAETDYSFKGDVSFKVAGNEVTTKLPRFNDSIESKESKEEVVKAYNELDFTEDNLKKLATASDARLLHDDAVERTDKLAKIVQTRLPVAPQSQGNYNLMAAVYEKKDDTADKHDISVTYSWAASSQLPSASLDPVVDPETKEEHYALDSDGNRLDPDFEYGLKLKYVDSTNANGETVKVPTFVWCKLAK